MEHHCWKLEWWNHYWQSVWVGFSNSRFWILFLRLLIPSSFSKLRSSRWDYQISSSSLHFPCLFLWWQVQVSLSLILVSWSSSWLLLCTVVGSWRGTCLSSLWDFSCGFEFHFATGERAIHSLLLWIEAFRDLIIKRSVVEFVEVHLSHPLKSKCWSVHAHIQNDNYHWVFNPQVEFEYFVRLMEELNRLLIGSSQFSSLDLFMK